MVSWMQSMVLTLSQLTTRATSSQREITVTAGLRSLPFRSFQSSCVAQTPQGKTKIRIEKFPRALANNATHLFSRFSREPTFRCSHFTMVLKPYPRGSESQQYHPPWLPWPPTRATHHARHVRNYNGIVKDVPGGLYKLDPLDGEENEKCDPLPKVQQDSPPPEQPKVHFLCITSKKQIHQHATIRNRVRTRLVAAFRSAIDQPPPLGVYVIHANPSAYSTPMDELVASMRKGILAITKTRRRISNSPRDNG